MADEHLASGRHHLRREPQLEVFFQRQYRFRLRPIALDDDGTRLVDVGEGFVEDFRANTPGQGLDPDACQELRKGGTGRRRVACLCNENGAPQARHKPARCDPAELHCRSLQPLVLWYHSLGIVQQQLIRPSGPDLTSVLHVSKSVAHGW
jgi:hypothetical protein